MISFPLLGNYGRLGNQLFQYAFLRTTARRLNTRFFCPRWDGDSIFDLRDGDERAEAPSGIIHRFDAHPEAGFAPEAMTIRDGTEVQGYFQSERYYDDKQAVSDWYRFLPEIVAEVTQRYGDLISRDCTSLSLRIDDDYAGTREYFPLYPLSYYRKALDLIGGRGPVLVLSDRPDRARNFFRGLEIGSWPSSTTWTGLNSSA